MGNKKTRNQKQRKAYLQFGKTKIPLKPCPPREAVKVKLEVAKLLLNDPTYQTLEPPKFTKDELFLAEKEAKKKKMGS